MTLPNSPRDINGVVWICTRPYTDGRQRWHAGVRYLHAEPDGGWALGTAAGPSTDILGATFEEAVAVVDRALHACRALRAAFAMGDDDALARASVELAAARAVCEPPVEEACDALLAISASRQSREARTPP